jgi:hypothetical protein
MERREEMHLEEGEEDGVDTEREEMCSHIRGDKFIWMK